MPPRRFESFLLRSMSTYEEQCLKWAKKNYPNKGDFDKVVLDTYASVSGGCPTCGPETDLTVEVYFYKDDKSVGWENIDITYGCGFADILKEIIEA